MASHSALSSARFSEPPSVQLLSFYQKPILDGEIKIFGEFCTIDKAHVVMLAEQGIISSDVACKLLAEIIAITEDGAAQFPVDLSAGSLLFQIEARLEMRLGQNIAGYLHTARSRIDQGATARRMAERAGVLRVMERILELQGVLASIVQVHVATIMPGYTHMQHAQSTSLGHHLLSFMARLEDDFDRLRDSFPRLNKCPLGAVGLAGTPLPINRHRTASLLGFGSVLRNSKLAREPHSSAEVGFCLAFIMSDLNDLATDFHIWSTDEFHFIELHESYCSSSSIFPQKRNPVALEVIKGEAGSAIFWGAEVFARIRGEGTGDQAIRSATFLPSALDKVVNMLELMTGVCRTLQVDEKRMREVARANWATASDLADLLVKSSSLSSREAHRVIATVVKICKSERISPEDVCPELINRGLRVCGMDVVALERDDIAVALDPFLSTQRRTSEGGTSSEQIELMLAASIQRAEAQHAWLTQTFNRLLDAGVSLDEAIAHIIS